MSSALVARMQSYETYFSRQKTALEVSIIADVDSIQRDFVQLQLIRPDVEITKDVFKALILENDDGLDNSGKRINDLSALLSRVGVSIFYLSTYQEDFVLVKEKRIPLVISTLEPLFNFTDVEALENPTIHVRNQQQMVITTPPAEEEEEFCFPVGAEPINIEDCLKPHNQQSTSLSLSHASKDPILGTSPVFFTSNFAEKYPITKYENEEKTMAEIRKQCLKRVTGHRLRLVGLNREFMESMSIILMKILFFPELLEKPGDSNDESASVQSRFLSYTATADGISLVTDESVLDEFPEYMLNMSSVAIPLRCIQMDLSRTGSLDKYGIVYSISNPLISSDINLLYLSTYKTANVLVPDSDLEKSLRILDNVDAETQLERETHEELG
ncbi:6247_t:CDS:2 [Ambispora leptoticha]|uniref:6247_t:CDS:1 n=1 Tax=Ambispora leptoticha TaxID=144679 RepID=A0A9N8YSF0_9GLOM|nr:6247_t:CDS:2 [Ambispora leptoticha]